MLLKTSASFFLPQELIKVKLSQELIEVKNFPHPLPVITRETPIGVLGIKPFNVSETYSQRCSPQDAIPCISTCVRFGEKRIPVDFEVNSDKKTLSTRESPGLKLPCTFNDKTKETRIVASENQLHHLAIQALNAANSNPLETCLISQIAETKKQNTAHFQLCGDTLYVHKALEYAWMSFPPAWALVEHLPTGQNSHLKPLKLCHVPDSPDWGFLYLFPEKETLFKVACYKFQGKLYLQDVWGMWQCAGDTQESDLSKKSQELTLSLGLSAYCLLKKANYTSQEKN